MVLKVLVSVRRLGMNPAHPLRILFWRDEPMSQKTVERILGKLVTDEGARQRFRVAPDEVLAAIASEVDALTPVEMEALRALDAGLLDRFADALDPRIQRVRIPSDAFEGGRT
jgi:metal-dependent HD superfamily phosphatase/phosphodiesterase